MKYFVTYCVMDNRIANPLEHACLVLSRQSGDRIEVTDAVGFYPGSPSYPDSWSMWFLKKVGFNFEPRGNYGETKQEEIRYLDLGYGLKGKTFEISEQQFNQLNHLHKKRVENEKNAVARARENLTNSGTKVTSGLILEEEKKFAQREGRQSQLTTFNAGTPYLHKESQIYTCKSSAIELLKEIGITPEFLQEFTRESPGMPRFSGKLEEIFFYSEGPRHRHASSRTGDIKFFREWKDDKLYWSLPPQYLVTGETEQFHDSELIKEAKKTISMLQRIEYVVVHAIIDSIYETQRQKLIEILCNIYSNFSNENLKINIDNAKHLLDTVYFAIDEECYDKNKAATVVSKLNPDSLSKICKIMGKTYYADEPKATLWL